MYHRRPMGTLIALEGIDGSGKSTQARRLRDALGARGIDAVLFREPGDSEPGDKLRAQFRDGRTLTPQEEADLFIADRRIDVRDNIEPALAAGRVVVMDRYYFSTMAYQGALGLDVEELREQNEAFAPRPDVTLILDVPADVSAERIRTTRTAASSYEVVEYLQRVREIFLGLCNGDVVRVDATQAEEVVTGEVLRRVLAAIEGRFDSRDDRQ